MDAGQAFHAVLHVDQYLGPLIAQYGVLVYGLLFALIFCETGFLPLFFLPGDPLLFICGALCAKGDMNLWVLMAVLAVATFCGSSVNYWIGRALGQNLLRHRYRWLDRNALKNAHLFYERHGGLTFLLSPYIAVVRTFAPFAAGIAGMPVPRFHGFVAVGAVIWVVSLLVAGFYFGNIPFIRSHLSAMVLLGVALGLASLAVGAILKYWRAR